MGKNLLTQSQIRNWKPGTPPRSNPPSRQDKLNSQMSISDGDGLTLFFNKKTDRKTWIFRKKGGIFGSTGIKITIGDVSLPLATVRKKRDEFLDMIARGVDPIEDKIQCKIKLENKLFQKRNTFDKVSKEWFKKFKDQLTTKVQKFYSRMYELHIQTHIGHLPIDNITIRHIYKVLEILDEKNKIPTRNSVLSLMRRIFQYGKSRQYNQSNPVQDVSCDVLKKHKTIHNRSLKLDELMEYFQKIEERKELLFVSTYYSLLLLPYLTIRKMELLQGVWDEIDFEKKIWVIPWNRMKMGRLKINPCEINHTIYLSDSVIQMLLELKTKLKEYDKIKGTRLSESRYVFPSYNNRSKEIQPITGSSFVNFLQKSNLIEKTTLHGFRSLAVSTLGDMGVSWEVRELMLSHHSNTTYHRSELENDRRNAYLMYSDIVDSYRLKVMQS